MKNELLSVNAGPFCPETAELFCLAAELNCPELCYNGVGRLGCIAPGKPKVSAQ